LERKRKLLHENGRKWGSKTHSVMFSPHHHDTAAAVAARKRKTRHGGVAGSVRQQLTSAVDSTIPRPSTTLAFQLRCRSNTSSSSTRRARDQLSYPAPPSTLEIPSRPIVTARTKHCIYGAAVLFVRFIIFLTTLLTYVRFKCYIFSPSCVSSACQ